MASCDSTGLLAGVVNGFFHARRSVRLSAACAALEMCALSEDEEALSPRVRCTREHIADSCGWGAEAVVDEILGRLQQEVLGAGGINESGLSPLHSPLASPMAKARGVKHARGKSPAASEKSDGTSRPRTGGSHGSVQHRAGTSTAGSHTSRGTHGDGKPPQAAGGGEDEETDEAVLQLEGLRLLLHVLGHVCPLSRRVRALQLLYQLMHRHELTVSADLSHLPPLSTTQCSSVVRLDQLLRARHTCPLASFQALVHIATAWSEGDEDDQREFNKDFRKQCAECVALANTHLLGIRTWLSDTFCTIVSCFPGVWSFLGARNA